MCFSCMQIRGDVPLSALPVWATVLLSFLLVPLSGLFAGLTIGLLSLDKVGLRVSVAADVVLPKKHNPCCPDQGFVVSD